LPPFLLIGAYLLGFRRILVLVLILMGIAIALGGDGYRAEDRSSIARVPEVVGSDRTSK